MTRPIIALALLLLAGSLQAQGPAPKSGEMDPQDISAKIENEANVGLLLQVAMAAREKQDYAIMEKAARRIYQLRPYVSQLAMMLVRAYALQDNKQAAYDLLLTLESQGVVVDLDDIPDLDKIKDTEVFLYLQHSFDVNGTPTGKPASQVQLGRSDLLVDGMAWDPVREQILVGSVTQGSVYRVGQDGQLETFIEPDEENGLLGVFDLLVDAERDTLWVSANALAHFEGVQFQDAGRAGVWKFELSTGKYQARFETPKSDQYLLTDMTLGPDGTVYVLNSKFPTVLQVNPEYGELRNFMNAPPMTGLRAIAMDDSGERMFFSDYQLGLFVVEMADQKLRAVTAPKNINLGGIDDLFYKNGDLYMIQNALPPMRIMRLKLSDDGVQVAGAQPLLSGLPELRTPATGTLVGDRLHVLSTSHWNLYDPKSGKPRSENLLDAPAVLVADLAAVSRSPEALFVPEEAAKKFRPEGSLSPPNMLEPEKD